MIIFYRALLQVLYLIFHFISFKFALNQKKEKKCSVIEHGGELNEA